MKSDLEVQDTKTNSPEMEAVIDAKGTTAQLHLTNSAISPIAAEGTITDMVYSTKRQDVILLAVIFILAAVAGVSWYMSS
jgi:hypothetical protein